MHLSRSGQRGTRDRLLACLREKILATYYLDGDRVARFPPVPERNGSLRDFSGILKKKDIQRVEERIEKVRAEDTTPQE